MSGEMVGQALDRVLNGVSVPRSITVGHGTKFHREPSKMGELSGVQLDFIRPGAVENAYINRLMGDDAMSV
jgi:hypothetical protein